MMRLSRRKLFDILFESLPIGCFIVDKDLEIIAFNKSAERLTGWNKEEVIGKACSKIIRSNLCRQFCPLREGAALKKNYIAREAKIKNRFGEEIPICFSSSTVFDESGKFEAGIEIFRDRGADHRLQTLRNHIISVFAHDIKTPISVNGAIIQRILGGKAGPVTQKQRDYLQFLLKESKQVELLINNLLELLNMESGRHPAQKVATDIESFIRETVEEMKPKALQHDIKLGFHVDKDIKRPVILDPVQLKRVISNLIDNAIKYSNSGGFVEVTTELQHNWLVIKVQDCGIGIPEEDLPHIFEYFYRAKNSISKAEGTGLGLSSARAIVESNGGRIWVKSKVGEGTTFFIRLPYEPDP